MLSDSCISAKTVLTVQAVDLSISTQVATHKIFGVRRPFSLKVIDAPQDFVASNFSLRLRKHNLEDYATKMATCVSSIIPYQHQNSQ